MKIISWNVNGLRAVQKKGFDEFVASTRPDVLCLQETRCDETQAELTLKGYHTFWSCAAKPGYSGTAILTKREPVAVTYGLGVKALDDEGRVITAEYESFHLVNVYTPNAQRELTRLPFRMKWDKAFLKFVTALDKTKPVIFGGDINVAHEEIDLANPKANKGQKGFTDEEREGFQKFLDAGFIDTFRMFEPGPKHYTWWSQRPGVRARNVGWRIDYLLASEKLRPRIQKAYILKDVMGSDHAPVVLEIAP
jgi:exodeoxyribonuclease-3